jgi:hypothetical protein
MILTEDIQQISYGENTIIPRYEILDLDHKIMIEGMSKND